MAPTPGQNSLVLQQQAVGSHRPLPKAYCWLSPLGLVVVVVVSSSTAGCAAVVTVVDGTLGPVPPKCLLLPLWS